MNNEIAKRYMLCSNCSDRILNERCDGKCKEYWKYVGAIEQKAIDEEVRLKKCDDMTEAEYDREVAFVDWYNKHRKGTPTYSDAIEWARKEVIDDACKWFDGYLMDIGYPDDWVRDSPNLKSGEERFRKAMGKKI